MEINNIKNGYAHGELYYVREDYSFSGKGPFIRKFKTFLKKDPHLNSVAAWEYLEKRQYLYELEGICIPNWPKWRISSSNPKGIKYDIRLFYREEVRWPHFEETDITDCVDWDPNYYSIEEEEDNWRAFMWEKNYKYA